MKDNYNPVPNGTLGVVDHVDDAGQIHVKWENGSSLALLYDEDDFEIINEKTMKKAFERKIKYIDNNETVNKRLEKKFEKYPLYSQDGKGLDAEVIAKFYNPYGHGTWLITEGDKQEDGDYLMFGYVQLSNPHDAEFGYVTLKQLESIEIKAKLNGIPFTIGSIERDIHLPEHCNLKQAMELSDIEIPLFLIDMQEETDEVYEDEEIEI